MSVQVLNRYTGAVLATLPGSNWLAQTFTGLNVSDADLSNRDLTGSTFRGCNVSGATFQNSDLSGCNFNRGNLFGSDLRGITKNGSSNFLSCFFESLLVDPNPNPVLIVCDGGQSNKVGTEVSAIGGLPDASIPFWFNQIGTGDTAAFVPLQVSPWSGAHGSEIVFCQQLKAQGNDVVEIKVAKGATTQSDWVPGTPEFIAMEASYVAALAALPAMYPGRYFRFLHNWYLGEDDARGGGSAVYGANYLAYQSAMSRILGTQLWRQSQIVLTQNWLANATVTALANVRYWQALFAGWTQNVDALPRQADNVHLTGPGEDALGALRFASWLQQQALAWP